MVALGEQLNELVDSTTDFWAVDSIELKRRVPLEWAFGELLGVWGLGHDKVTCPHPDHEDSTPSFNLWAPDDYGVFQKFGCLGCSFRGDLFDLIEYAKGVGFADAVGIARDLADEYSHSGYEVGTFVKEEISPEQIRLEYEALCMAPAVGATLLRLLMMKSMPPAMQPYLETEWRWRGHANGSVSFPHFSVHEELTGVKFRDARIPRSRWGIDGGHYYSLYGSWRDRGRRNVVLVEGETDTAWTAWSLRNRECEVFGWTTAKLRPNDESLHLLKDRKVWMLPHGDSPGLECAEYWADRLTGAVILKSVPPNKDVQDCGIPVATLLGLPKRRAAEDAP